MNVTAGGVENEQPRAVRRVGDRPGGGRRKRMAGLVCGGEPVHGVGVAEEIKGAIKQRRDRLIENDPAHGDGRFRRARVAQPDKLAPVRKGDVIDLGKVVIFTG